MKQNKFTKYDWHMLFVLVNLCLAVYFAVVDDMPHAIYYLIWANMWAHEAEREEDKNGIS